MQRELCEDILEAMLLTGTPDGSGVTGLRDLASRMGRSESELETAVSRLEERGCISRSQNRLLMLSEKGLKTAQLVAARHRVLECFLSTILGMSPGEASREACSLEHSVSDRVIGRIGEYIEGKGPGCREAKSIGSRALPGDPLPARRADGTREPDALPPHQTLEDAPLHKQLHVRMVHGGDCLTRLLDLGIVPGETVTLIRRLPNGAVVVCVKGTEIALSPEVAAIVEVELSE